MSSWAICYSAFLCAASPQCLGQSAAPQPSPPATLPAAEMIALNFPDNVEVKSLIEYVSDRLGINILYDEQVANQRLTIKTPAEIPKSSLLGLLESALKMKGFVLVDGDQPGWKRVVPSANLVQSARAATRPTTGPGGPGVDSPAVVTQVFALRFGDPAKADAAIKPFLTVPGGNSLVLAEQRLIVVTDFASNLPRVAQLVELVDRPQRASVVRFVPLRFVEAAQASAQVTQLLASKLKQQAAGVGGPQPADAVDVTPEPRTNRLALIGTAELLDQAEALVRQIDVPVEVETRYYALRSASPDRIDRLARELVRPIDLAKVYNAVVDKEANVLIVTGTPQMQRQVGQLITSLDVAVPQAQSPIRFYKLTNTTAADILETVQAIAGDAGGTGAAGDARSATAAPLYPGANRPPAAAGQQPPTPPAYQSGTGVQGATGAGAVGGAGGTANTGQAAQGTPASAAPVPLARTTVKTRDATVTADPNTNTIIVVAPPSVQAFYEQMIQSLDKRRPQVLVECTIVTLDTTNDLSLGVEVGGDTRTGNANLVTFSSFGLSTPNASTGGLALIPGTGFNAALLKPDVGSLVIRALADSGRSEVFSAPKVLVNDNATGTLSSIAEAPFTSVNASQTVSTTSFGGYASAGTTITLTPHISEADHLNLEYTVELNSFTGQGSEGIPPPRQTDSVTSKVTIPDGDMIVVGGLNRKNFSQTQSGIPLLRLIPVLKYLFSNNARTDETTTLFVFIRPVILRDDQFRDLKYYSGRDAAAAKLDADLPQSEPLLVR